MGDLDRTGPDTNAPRDIDVGDAAIGAPDAGPVVEPSPGAAIEEPRPDVDPSMATLDPDQHAVVTSDARHLLVLAGAGTGKTRALVHRVIRLLDAGVSPSEILLLTFTRKAASTMRERLDAWTRTRGTDQPGDASTAAAPLYDDLGAPLAQALQVGTFHTMAWRAVRAVAPTLGVIGHEDAEPFDAGTPRRAREHAAPLTTSAGSPKHDSLGSPTLRLSDPDEAQRALAKLLADAASRGELDRAPREVSKVQDGLRALSWRLLPERAWALVRPDLPDAPLDAATSIAPEERDDPIDPNAPNDPDAQDRKPVGRSGHSTLPLFTGTARAGDPMDDVRRAWTEHQRQHGFITLDDVVAWWWHALDRGLATSPAHVLVDEIQDLDPLQWAVVARLAARAQSVTLVGDLAQSIYGFRGAVPPRLDELRASLPELRVLTLRHNYRSNAPLVALGNAARADDVRCIPTRRGQAPPVVLQLRDALQQAEFVAQRCEEIVHDGRTFTDVAVLARTKAELLDVAREFASRGIPYRLRAEDDPDEPIADTAAGAHAVELSTVHRAKGLEWPVVFVIGLVEGRFPLWGSDRTPATREEESRLFHVAVTRARDDLYLTHPAVDATSGLRASTPSRFLRRLERALGEDPPLLQRWDVEEAPRE